MSEMALNFDFSPELVLNLGTDQLFLVEDLESYNELGSLLSSKVDMPELTSTHWLSYLKVIDCPIFWTELSWLLVLICHDFNLLIINILLIFDLHQRSLLHF